MTGRSRSHGQDELETVPDLGDAGRPTASRYGDEHIWALDFPEWREVRGRLSVADLFKLQERTGVYVLGFEDGERYVGQAVDVANRFAQHRKTHGDISHLTFKRVPKAQLDDVERHHIHHLEAQGLKLRNIAHMSVVQGERDFDLVVSPEEQERWMVGDVEPSDDAQEHVQDDDLRRRYHRRFEQFMALPQAQEALLVLGMYIDQVIPFPRRTELAFWSVSCVPYGGPPRSNLYCRVSLNMQEVMSLGVDEEGGLVTFHVASSSYREAFGDGWREQLEQLGWEFDDHQYAPGGHDQIRLFAASFEDARTLLMDGLHSDAMRRFNLRLMRKGPNYYSQFHCLDLVDAAYHEFNTRLEDILAEAEGKVESDDG